MTEPTTPNSQPDAAPFGNITNRRVTIDNPHEHTAGKSLLHGEVRYTILRYDGAIDPRDLITNLWHNHAMSTVIEALQQALERGEIILSPEGYVVLGEHA